MTIAEASHHGAEAHACCAANSVQPAQPAPHASDAHHGGWRGAASVTLHCLSGCAIGELLGLAIGVSLSTIQRFVNRGTKLHATKLSRIQAALQVLSG